CACDAVVVAEPMFTPAQVGTLQAYVETGSVRGAAKRRCCSEQTVRRHLANARRRLDADNVAQLVYIACAAGVLTPVYSTNWSQKWQKLGIDAGGGRYRIRVEFSKRRRCRTMFREGFVRLRVLLAILGAGVVIVSAIYACPNPSHDCFGEPGCRHAIAIEPVYRCTTGNGVCCTWECTKWTCYPLPCMGVGLSCRQLHVRPGGDCTRHGDDDYRCM
ncbi:MAG: hypothetical protein K6U75_17220, partial [Firmicutes bacterium]|nr:hypothetical protein [Bacillota bacterium]